MKNIIKANLMKLTELDEIANNAEIAYEKEPENEELEKAFDEAYKEQFEMMETLINQFEQFAEIERKIAKEMICGYRKELLQILA